MSLTAIQERAAELLAGGMTHEEAAKELDVVRVTVTRWNTDPDFKGLVKMLAKQKLKSIDEELLDSVPMAVATIIEIAKTGGHKETVNSQLRAAMYILENAKKLKDATTKGNRHTQRSGEPLSEDEYDELLKR